jgi:hypothetical protein
VKFCWLAPVVFSPSVLEEVFHVKSRVSAVFSFIVLRYLLVAFITASSFNINMMSLLNQNVSRALLIKLNSNSLIVWSTAACFIRNAMHMMFILLQNS